MGPRLRSLPCWEAGVSRGGLPRSAPRWPPRIACGGGSDDAAGGHADAAEGAELYAGACSACHGTDLRGTERGPSHLSTVYEPGHHPDEAFRSAVLAGSPQHHWTFGDMPPVTGLDEAEIDAVIAYIREVQEREGFEPYPP